jgi:hypothetical protein
MSETMPLPRRSPERHFFIGGSDARIIMGSDEAALVRLWRERPCGTKKLFGDLFGQKAINDPTGAIRLSPPMRLPKPNAHTTPIFLEENNACRLQRQSDLFARLIRYTDPEVPLKPLDRR